VNALASSEGVFVAASAVLDLADAPHTLQALAVDAGGSVSLGTGTLTIDGSLTPNFTALLGTISGTGGLVVNGFNTTIFTDGQQTYSGGTTINDGVMFLGVDDAWRADACRSARRR
jgi:autotransporter-associated beta strand protein